MDCSPPSSTIHGISQARILEWVAISFFRRSSQPRDQAWVSCIGRWILYYWITSCSVTQSCLTLCDPMNGSVPGFPVLHHLPEFAPTHVHWVCDAIQPSHPLSASLPDPFVSRQGHRPDTDPWMWREVCHFYTEPIIAAMKPLELFCPLRVTNKVQDSHHSITWTFEWLSQAEPPPHQPTVGM